MADRYFVETPIEGSCAMLVGAEAHHLAHVMRGKPGDVVVLFDGRGGEFQARVERVGRAEIELAVLSQAAIDRELTTQIVLGVALPKGDRPRWLVEKATELGVARLVPLATERTSERATAASLDRLRRSVIESSKQCGRNFLMEITPVESLGEYLAGAAAGVGGMRLIAEIGARDLADVVDPSTTTGLPHRVALAIGPEGDFTPAELELAKSLGWQPVGLGTRVLRVETAALTLVAALVTRMRGSSPPR